MAEDTNARSAWIESVLQKYERPLLRYVASLTGDLELARDVVQDAFFKLCKASRPKVEKNLAAWLYTVCRNRAFDIQKKEGRMGRILDARTVADRGTGPAKAAAASETLERILEALETLSEDHREAFRLKFQDQLTYREISQVMGKSLGTVSNLISTALCTVRDHLAVNAGWARES